MTPKVIVPADEEPISIEQCRAHLEAPIYGDTDVDDIDDIMILAWLGAAREHCENFLGLSLSPRTLEIALDSFPTTTIDGRTWVELPMGPVTEIVSVSVGEPSDDTDAEEFELAADTYVLDDYKVPARLVTVSGWPSITTATNAIKVRYIAGYEIDTDGVSSMPKSIRAAMLLILGHLYANREDSTEKSMQSIPNGAEALMRPLRVLLGMA